MVTLDRALLQEVYAEPPRDRRAAATPPWIYARWPSLLWGEREWTAVLLCDQDLYFDLLEGIARAGATKSRSRVQRSTERALQYQQVALEAALLQIEERS